MDLLAIYSPCGGGHKAAAIALKEAANARGLSCELVDLFALAPRFATEPYLFAHYGGQSRAPDWYGAGYHATNKRNGALEPLRLTIDRVLFANVRKCVREKNPRAIASTHHLPLVVLGRERRKNRLHVPVVGVVTDYAAHACWAERGVDRFCVPSLRAESDLVRHGISAHRIHTTGIPIRAAFEKIARVRAPLKNEPLRVLVTSGGFGVGPMERIVRSFLGKNVELTVVCGAAKNVEARMRSIGNARVIGFEPDMAPRVAEAHVIVGKAGGLTVSEAMRAGRPMILVGAVPGQEKFNESFVVGGGAGLACDADRAGDCAAQMRAAGLIEPMGARGRLLAVPDAAARVLHILDGLAARAA